MTRAEHLQWCKDRALAELDVDPTGRGPVNALASMNSDLRKHEETAGHLGIELGVMLAVAGKFRQPGQVREWIEGLR